MVAKALSRNFAAVLAESDRIGLPVRFATDVTEHDRASLERRDPSLPFAWMVWGDGSYLVFPRSGLIDAYHHAHEMPEIVGRTFAHVRFYWWDGVALVDAGGHERLATLLREQAAADAEVERARRSA